MQKRTFRPLYEKYRDAGSPYLEPLSKTEARLRHPNGAYYRIELDGQTAGALYLSLRGPGKFRLGPLFVLPEFQNRGIAQAAIRALEARHGPGVWELDTLLQEPGNCHLYEKMGYKRTGTQTVVNSRLTLIDYQKIVK
ncbi:MAG TPA: GNAT family N-acetyltransferase [Candidatus Merdivicinus faecavium]|nr:GNAT family N-acetyltransferase [Candidatus Merdivicinus faecavium]